MSAIAAGEITEPRVGALLRQAAEWRLLGLLFERPHDGWSREVLLLSREVADPEIRAAADAAREEATEGAYLAVVGPGGPVSLREVTYRGMEDPGRILADIGAFYEAFAFRPETEEAPDHLAVEAGALGYLSLKEAYARARTADDDAEMTARAAARFREEHVARLAWPVAERLQDSGVRYLALAAAAAASRSGHNPEDALVTLSPAHHCDECPMECDDT
jgi:nitrate reductase assembly molybdenum cofactor insertion protein NarJ